MPRAGRVLEALAERELDSLLVTDLLNVRWLTGFTGTNGVCLVSGQELLFLTDFRYVEQAGEQVGGFKLLPAGRNLLADLIAHTPAGRVGFDDAHLSVRDHGKIAAAAPRGVELRPAGGLVEGLREVKDAAEVERIAAAAELATAAFERVLERGLVGRTERAVALDLEQEMRIAGAEEAAFPPIVAAGAHGALPHAAPREVEIPRGQLVVIDWGARLDGYCSDCTRTLATGELGGRGAEVYGVVLEAQERGVAAVRAGASCVEVDGAARSVIDAADYGERFGHGLGHGVGLDVHEGPRLAKNAEGELREGMVVTVEPGVYLPGELGVRIEDLTVVRESGSQVLTTFPKALMTV